MTKNNTIYDYDEELDELTEEELDELYRPKKQNNRKHSLPLFVYLILKEYSSNEKRLSQQIIMEILSDKYELEIERKSLSRTIHDLEDEHIGVHSLKTGGVWYEYYE